MSAFLKKVTIYIFLVIPFHSIFAVSWAILPVKFDNMPEINRMTGPALNTDDPEIGWEMAKLFQLYLKSNDVNSILPMTSVRRAYTKNNLGLNANLSENELKSLARDIDADKLLMTEIQYSKGLYKIIMRVFFSQAEIISDSYALSGENLYRSLGQALRDRFSFKGLDFIDAGMDNSFVFGIDGSGKNYEEIRHLDAIIRDLDVNKISAVTIDGYNKSFVLKTTHEKSDFFKYLETVKPKSVDTTDRLYPNLLSSVTDILTKDSKGKKIIFLLVSSAPKTTESKQRTNGYIRRLSQQNPVIIFASGKLSLEERNYWISLSSLRKNMHYIDIVYKQKIGLSDGNEVFILKSGDKLLESNIGSIENSHEILLTTDQARNFTQENIPATFENATQKDIVSTGKIQISYNLKPASDLFVSAGKDSDEPRARILLMIEDKPFWISLPYKSIFDENGHSIEKDYNYYFLLNLSYGGQGIPLRNSKNFGRVINSSENCTLLLLNIGKFLKNPDDYLGKSIGGSSIYIIYGKVKDIQLEKKRIY